MRNIPPNMDVPLQHEKLDDLVALAYRKLLTETINKRDIGA